MRRTKVRWSMVGPGRAAIAIVALIALVSVALQAKAALPDDGRRTNDESINGPSSIVHRPSSTEGIVGPIVIHEEKHDLSPRLDSIPPVPPQPKGMAEREQGHRRVDKTGVHDIDTVVQSNFGPLAMPAPILNFAGINFINSFCNCAPPDTNGEVGRNHYVQTTNSAFQVFNKTNGLPVGPSIAINTLWAGFGGACQNRNDGDPVVNYDQLADRWVISQFTATAPYYQCIAVSASGDPSGSYHRYAFFESNTVFGDYPKVGVWPDGYYMSTNEWVGQNWYGGGNYAFDRSHMLSGLTASAIYFHLPATDWGGQQPSDLDGSTLPPAGAPNTFVEVDDSAWDPPNIPTDQIQMWRFHADFTTPANASFTALPPITPPTLAPFDAVLCDLANCVPQPGTTDKLDTLSDRLMFRVAYRNYGSYQSITFNHTVDVGTNIAGIRWYEIRGIHTTPSIFQQGTYAPSSLTDHHWMGSLASDRQGNMALGYSVSNATTIFPSIRYTGRLVSDPLGTLPQGEAVIQNGTGSQLGTDGRWGDYSDMTVDPVDDCTFWYTNEYYPATATFAWQTKIASFKFPGCIPPTPTPTSSPTRTRTPRPTQTPGGPTATPQPTACPIQFSDVPQGSTFYDFVRCLACRGIINGYGDGSFKPNANVTRGQLSKIVSNSAGFTDPQSTQMFWDIPPGSTFFDFIGRLASRGYISGYNCGGVGEPCHPPDNLPYFRPNNNATRGQISKIVSNAANFTEPHSGQTFQDVPQGSTFYIFVERLASRGVMSGYTCGGIGEPCIGPGNLPYFRPNANATRGQTSKIVANTFFPECETPSRARR